MHKKQQCLFTSVLSDFAPFLQLGKREIPLQHVKYQKFKSSETLKYHLKILFNLIKFLIYLSKKCLKRSKTGQYTLKTYK